MDVLVAVGSSTAYFYSIPVTLGLLGSSDGMMGSTYVYFKTAAVIITLIVLVKLLEARAKGRTSEPIKKLMGMRPRNLAPTPDKAGQHRWHVCAWSTHVLLSLWVHNRSIHSPELEIVEQSEPYLYDQQSHFQLIAAAHQPLYIRE